MRYRAHVDMDAKALLDRILEMPAERGANYAKSLALSASIGRTYTRQHGDSGFQISETAGMSLFSAIGTGSIAAQHTGSTVALAIRFGVAPVWLFRTGCIVLGISAALALALGWNWSMLGARIVPSVLILIAAAGWWSKRSETKFLLRALSERIGAVHWERVSA